MGMWEESVDLALEMGELELAKINADRAEEDEVLRKKLWSKVARYVVQDKKDIKTAMRFLDNTTVLKIEDILPFFPDFVVIDDFKDEICNALEGYSAHIESLKAEMEEATQTAESIKHDIDGLKNRFVTLEQSERCSTCELPLLTRQFYVFPCQHSFHADCLIGQVKEYLPAASLRKILNLQNELVKLSTLGKDQSAQRALLSANYANGIARAGPGAPTGGSGGRNMLAVAGDRLRDLIIPESITSAFGVWGGRVDWMRQAVRGSDHVEPTKLDKLREELDDLLASSCPLCESVVAGVDKPFVLPGELEKQWEL
jgi:hypothetical protein